MKKTLIYIGVPGSKVFESQVIELLIQISKENYFDQLFLLAGVKEENQNYIDELKKNEYFTVVPFKQYPNFHFFNRKQRQEFNAKMKPFLVDNSIIHTRSESYSFVLKSLVASKKLSNVKILTDVRGAVYEEAKNYHKLKFGIHQLKLFQHYRNLKGLAKTSDFVSCVSIQLKEYLVSESGIDSDKVFVNHCLAGRNFKFSESARRTYRKKMNIDSEDTLFIFATGGNSGWQNTEEIIFQIATKGYKVLNLSKSKVQHENVINLFVPYQEVPHYLCAADIGIIWRNDDIVNQVASPVKFSEYVCSGLPVVANRGVGLINEYITNTGFGILVDELNEVSGTNIEILKTIPRDKISSQADTIFSLDQISNKYLEVYKTIQNE